MNRKSFVTVIVALAAAAGCATTPGSSRADTAGAVQAGKTTFVRVPNGHGQFGVVAYPPPGAAVCPDCARAAKDYFKTGTLHNSVCERCGTKFVVVHGQPIGERAGS